MSHFLRPLLRQGASDFALVNQRTGSVVVTALEAALDSRARRRGLLGRDGLADGHALVLAPCNAVHTWFMKFPIDIVFVARDGRVLEIAERVGAWKIAVSLRAFAVIELAAGAVDPAILASGDRVALERVRQTPFRS